MQTTKTGIYWLGNDLRLHDNACLKAAAESVDHLLIVYCLDPAMLAPGSYQALRMGGHRLRFLIESLQAMDKALRQYGQQLAVFSQHPLVVLPRVIEHYKPSHIFRSLHHTIDEQRQWQQVRTEVERARAGQYSDERLYQQPSQWCEMDNLTVFSRQQIESITGLDFFNPQAQPKSARFPKSFSQFRQQIDRAVKKDPLVIPPPVEIDLSLPKPVPISPQTFNSLSDILVDELDALLPSDDKGQNTDQSTSTYQFAGGEEQGLAHLGKYFADQKAHHYKSVRNELAGWDNSTKLSAWLANGCLSVREVLASLHRFEQHSGKTESSYWIYFELLWREYFYWYALHYKQHLFAFDGIEQRRPLTSYYPQRYKSWTTGTTEYALVNACMRELNSTGYLSNRGRQIVASCFVNELELDWRFGAAYFEQQLIDYDAAVNWGNWQYLAGVGADPRSASQGAASGRHFDLDKQQQRYDADGSYRNQWLNPEDKHSASNVTVMRDFVDAADWPISG